MVATKGDIHLPGDGLGARLEELLRAYGDSVGDHGPAVPAELLQAATRIDESRAGIQQHGPADAVAGEEDAGDEQAPVEPPDECAAILHGGVDDLSPLQLWDNAMQKYGVMQQAEAAVAAAEDTSSSRGASRALSELERVKSRCSCSGKRWRP